VIRAFDRWFENPFTPPWQRALAMPVTVALTIGTVAWQLIFDRSWLLDRPPGKGEHL
jgi:hypothetical protein